MIGAGLASLTLFYLLGSRMKRRVDLVSRGRDALARTEKEGKEAMKSHSDEVDRGLERFRKLFEDFRPPAVSDAARWLYASDVYFNDGFAELKGSDALARYLGRSASMTARLDVDVEETIRTGDAVYMRWVLTYTTKSHLTVSAPGISHLRFNSEGRITYHRDYWDAGSALLELLPFAGAILGAIRRSI